MNFGQFQPPIWRTLDRKPIQTWWLANMEDKHLKLWLLCCCLIFCPHKCASLIVVGQVVCPNILKCQFILSQP